MCMYVRALGAGRCLYTILYYTLHRSLARSLTTHADGECVREREWEKWEAYVSLSLSRSLAHVHRKPVRDASLSLPPHPLAPLSRLSRFMVLARYIYSYITYTAI